MKLLRREIDTHMATKELVLKSYDHVLEQSEQLRQTYDEEHDLLTKLHDLRTSLEIFQKRKRKIENSCKLAVDDYVRLSCVSLCQLMYTSLPPELREQIYTYLLGPGGTERITEPESAKPQRFKTQRVSKILTRRFNQAPPSKHPPQLVEPSYFDLSLQDQNLGVGGYEHWLYHAYTGEYVDCEIIAHWYRAQTFLFEHAKDRGWMTKFLQTDVFGKNLVPGNFVQHIQVNVWESDVLSPKSKAKLKEDLRPLKMIGNKNVRLVLRISVRSSVMERGFRDLIACLKPMVKKLRKAGFLRVQVREKGRLNRKGKEKDGRDVTRLFS